MGAPVGFSPTGGSDEGNASGSSDPWMAVAAVVGATGGSDDRVSVLQAVMALIAADEGDNSGSSGSQMATAPAVREAGGGTGQGSAPQEVACTSLTSVVPVASSGGGSNQTIGCGDGVQGSGSGYASADLMHAITSSL
jgi:hypothetical protein